MVVVIVVVFVQNIFPKKIMAKKIFKETPDIVLGWVIDRHHTWIILSNIHRDYKYTTDYYTLKNDVILFWELEMRILTQPPPHVLSQAGALTKNLLEQSRFHCHVACYAKCYPFYTSLTPLTWNRQKNSISQLYRLKLFGTILDTFCMFKNICPTKDWFVKDCGLIILQVLRLKRLK